MVDLTCRPTQNAPETTKVVVANEASIRLHELAPYTVQVSAFEALGESCPITLYLRGQICIRRRRAATWHHLDHVGGDSRGQGYVFESLFHSQLINAYLMVRE